MLHRSRTNFFPARLNVFRQPAAPISSGVSGPPDTSLRGGIAAPVASSGVVSDRPGASACGGIVSPSVRPAACRPCAPMASVIVRAPCP
jgi:hypothetical protein